MIIRRHIIYCFKEFRKDHKFTVRSVGETVEKALCRKSAVDGDSRISFRCVSFPFFSKLKALGDMFMCVICVYNFGAGGLSYG